MKKLALTILLISSYLGAMSQANIGFFGEVRDTLGVPLQFANVLAIDTATQTMEGFAVTNPNGQFKLRLPAGQVYLLKVTFIGFSPAEQLIQPLATNDDPYLFVLSSDVTELGVLEIVAEMPVTMQGDTIIYQVEAFNQGNERKLEDVLEDLPGFQIEENGDIRVQGEKVDKVLIDGKEFFNGDSKLATKNIPANVVDRVQVLQNFNAISPLRGVNNSEQLAINIELKEDKKRMVFGDIRAGVGPQSRYLGHANSFYYDERTNLNLIADANNVGELAFTMNDYFRFAGGFGSLMQGSGSNFSVRSDQLSIPVAERNTASRLSNQLAAFNMNLRPVYGWQLTGFAIGSMVDNDFGSVSNRTYLQEQGTLQEGLQSSRNVESQSGIGQIAVTYTPNPDLQIDYQLFGRWATVSNVQKQLSAVGDQENNISNEAEQVPWSLQQRLSGYYAIGENDVASLAINHSVQFQDPMFSLMTDLQPFAGVIDFVEASSFGLQQSRTIRTDNLETVGNYYHIINRKNHINVTFGMTRNDQSYDAELLQMTSTDLLPITGISSGNDANFTLDDRFVGLLLKNKWKKITWSPQLSLHAYAIDFSQIGPSASFDRLLLLPALTAKYDMRNSISMSFDYRMNVNFMDVQSMVSNLLVASYNSISRGNPTLTNGLFHALSLNYRSFNMYSFLNIYGGLSYQRKIDDIQNSIALNDWERISVPINVIPVNEDASAYFNIEKRFDDFRMSLDSKWNYSVVNNQLAEQDNTNINFQQRYKMSVSTRLWKKINLRLSHELVANQYQGNQGSNTFVNQESSIRVRLEMLDGLQISTSYRYNNYLNLSNEARSQFDLLDASITYRKEGSPWEYSLNGMNLLDTRFIQRDSFSDNLISTYAYEIQQRYGLLTIMYDL